MPTLSLLGSSGVVVMTTYGATSDDKVGILRIPFSLYIYISYRSIHILDSGGWGLVSNVNLCSENDVNGTATHLHITSPHTNATSPRCKYDCYCTISSTGRASPITVQLLYYDLPMKPEGARSKSNIWVEDRETTRHLDYRSKIHGGGESTVINSDVKLRFARDYVRAPPDRIMKFWFFVSAGNTYCQYHGIIIQIKIFAEYRDMLPRPRLVCQEPGLRPRGRSPGVPDKSSRGLGSMSRYSAQILICFIAYIFLFLFLCGFGWEFCRTAIMHSAIVHCNQNEACHQTIKVPSMPCRGGAGP